jgi:hypothetical protein
VKHDCMDAGGRATNGAVAEDARTELSREQFLLNLDHADPFNFYHPLIAAF